MRGDTGWELCPRNDAGGNASGNWGELKARSGVRELLCAMWELPTRVKERNTLFWASPWGWVGELEEAAAVTTAPCERGF